MVAERLEADLVRLRAPNPGPLTGDGTNSYILGRERLVIIDPGPTSRPHLAALLAAVDDRPVDRILVTHSHLDHSPLARDLSQLTGAPVAAFGPTGAGRSAIMEELAKDSEIGGGEGADPDFVPHEALPDGTQFELEGDTITALHTPGHFGNHMCFAWRDALFSGDHVMGWATTLISPPDGDLTDFMSSCERLRTRAGRVYYPGHGTQIDDPISRVTWLMDHRRSREKQVLNVLTDGPATPGSLTQSIYTDVAPSLWPAAERNVLAHLIDLTTRGITAPKAQLSAHCEFHLT